MNFSIIIPVFNEEKNIHSLIKEIFFSVKNEKSYQIIIINDASTDNTSAELDIIKKKFSEVVLVLNNKNNIGQSLSLIKGIEKSKYDTIVTIDGDGQNNPKDIPLLLKKYFEDEEILLVGGIRFKRKDSLVKMLSSRIANNIRKFILNDNCIDTGCSLKVFDRKLFLRFPKFRGMHRFLPALFKGYGSKTFFINVDHRPRKYGYSKYGTLSRLFAGISDLIRVYIIIKKYKKYL
tara:strand:- start:11294 stop:11995 length:702 start_codon:yes stop_codon:yes gene_type:complete